jgi:hypothetical protein
VAHLARFSGTAVICVFAASFELVTLAALSVYVERSSNDDQAIMVAAPNLIFLRPGTDRDHPA